MLLSVRETIQKLQSFTNTSFPIISVYLEVASEEDPRPLLLKKFRALVQQEIETDKKRFEQDIDYIDAFLQQYTNTHKSRGIAIFSGGNTVWEVITTPYTLQYKLVIDHSPFLLPILEELSEYQRYLVVLADKKKAKFFTLYLGTLEDQAELTDDAVPQQVKGRNTDSRFAPDKIDRRIKEHMRQHFTHISQKLAEFVEKKPLSGVVMGGHKEIIHTLEKHLPKELQEKIVGEFAAEPDVPINEAVDKSREILQNLNKNYRPQNRSRFTL
jgi:hypothetical protein